MTEDEASGKACCGPHGCGKPLGFGDGRRCIGGSCMAWWWTVDPAEIGGHSDYGFVSATINWGDGSTTTVKRGANLVPTGYCGLAGKP